MEACRSPSPGCIPFNHTEAGHHAENQPGACSGMRAICMCRWSVRDTDIIAPVLPRDGEVFGYDCLEVLLLPDLAKREYWEIDVGATGSIFDALNIKHPHAWGAEYHPEANMTGLRVATRIDGVAKQPGAVSHGYTIEMAIPFDELPGARCGQKATAGMHLHCLLTHFDRHADGRPRTYAFCPLLTWVHNIWNYARDDAAAYQWNRHRWGNNSAVVEHYRPIRQREFIHQANRQSGHRLAVVASHSIPKIILQSIILQSKIFRVCYFAVNGFTERLLERAEKRKVVLINGRAIVECE